MKRICATLIALAATLGNISLMAQTKINIAVNGHNLTATLEDNSSAVALADLLKKGPVTVDADAYGGFEMVGALPASLPRNDRQITTRPGDIILYTGRNICFYYGVNEWNFTRLGTVDNAASLDLKTIYGARNGSARFVLTLAESSGIGGIADDDKCKIVAIHRITGERVSHNDPALLEKGVYIVTERGADGRERTRKIVAG